MNIIQTPLRMSFLGGGTDVPEYYNEHGGSVIVSSFDKYVYLGIRNLPPFFKHKNQFSSSTIERFNSPDEVMNPVVRESFKLLKMENIHVIYDCDLPARSGLGTSSAFSVGLLNGFHRLKGQILTKEELAEEAVLLERTLCNEPGGVQDQYAVAFGGFNRIYFNESGVHLSPINISEERKTELNNSLLLYYTGIPRNSFEIMEEQIQNIKSITSQLKEMSSFTDEGEKILISGDINDFGILLDNAWQLKRKFSTKTTNSYIDSLYERAKNAGALGGKILGAGGGGCILFYVEPDKQSYFKKQFLDLFNIEFSFEEKGTNVLYQKSESLNKSFVKL